MRFTIGRRIWMGFGLLILLNLIVLFLTNVNLNKSKDINERLTGVFAPAEESLEEFKLRTEQSRILANFWANVETKPNVQEKKTLINIIEVEIPKLKDKMDSLATAWPESDRILLEQSYNVWDDLKGHYEEVMMYLPEFNSYQNVMNLFMARDLTDPGGVINEKVTELNNLLEQLLYQQRRESGQEITGMTSAFENMRFILTVLGSILMFGGILIAYFTARSIVKPTNRLRDKLITLSKGVVPRPEHRISKDEIGDMKNALNQLISGQTRVREFVNAIGSGDFQADYEPLSVEDEMAPDFIRTREELAENERITEKKINERTQALQEKTDELAEKNRTVTELYQDLKDSIQYAKRLQDSILPSDEIMNKIMGESFVYFNPKDVVSGDFYWTAQVGKYSAFAAIDCTGHGVPGAFMSLVGFNSLNRAIRNVENPTAGTILDAMNQLATEALYRKKGDYEVRDGMDMAICLMDNETKTLQFAGAGRPLTFVRDGQIEKIKGDRMAIGGATEDTPNFTTHTVQMQTGDMIYIFSDGYPDQFGGDDPNRTKKFMVGQFYKLLEKVSHLEMQEQSNQIDQALVDWMGEHPQIDDIVVMGVKVR